MKCYRRLVLNLSEEEYQLLIANESSVLHLLLKETPHQRATEWMLTSPSGRADAQKRDEALHGLLREVLHGEWDEVPIGVTIT